MRTKVIVSKADAMLSSVCPPNDTIRLCGIDVLWKFQSSRAEQEVFMKFGDRLPGARGLHMQADSATVNGAAIKGTYRAGRGNESP